eukprot:TRINITY_DN100972_c0_g1_i1.p1 TRINITY_DN100972_c0_g1~~TRINITY_DN100972_c0_g1_i1.p1  ORF type:complete len:668 (+),score=24.86 TRINITY_DN100972_c0_g1_i1:75-2006(+)
MPNLPSVIYLLPFLLDAAAAWGQTYFPADVLAVRRCRIVWRLELSCDKETVLWMDAHHISKESPTTFLFERPVVCAARFPAGKLPAECKFRCGDIKANRKPKDLKAKKERAPFNLLHAIWRKSGDLLWIGQLCQVIRRDGGVDWAPRQTSPRDLILRDSSGMDAHDAKVADVLRSCQDVPEDELSWYDNAFIGPVKAGGTLSNTCREDVSMYVIDSYGHIHTLLPGADVHIVVNEAHRDRSPVVYFCGGTMEFQGWNVYIKQQHVGHDFLQFIPDLVGLRDRIAGAGLHAVRVQRKGSKVVWTLLRCSSQQLESLRINLFGAHAGTLGFEVGDLLDDAASPTADFIAPSNCAWADDPTIDRCRAGREVWIEVGGQAYKLGPVPTTFAYGGSPRGLAAIWFCGTSSEAALWQVKGARKDEVGAERAYVEFSNALGAVFQDGVVTWFGLSCDFKNEAGFPKRISLWEHRATLAAVNQTVFEDRPRCRTTVPRVSKDVDAAYIDHCRDPATIPLYVPDSSGVIHDVRAGRRVYMPRGAYMLGAKTSRRGFPMWCGSRGLIFAQVPEYNDNAVLDFVSVERDVNGVVRYEILSCPPETLPKLSSLRRQNLTWYGELIQTSMASRWLFGALLPSVHSLAIGFHLFFNA